MKYVKGRDGTLTMERPRVVTVGTSISSRVAVYILFDDDDVFSGPSRRSSPGVRAALSAMCVKAARTKKNAQGYHVISVNDVFTDTSLWADSALVPKATQRAQWIADNLKPLFAEALVLSNRKGDSQIIFRCDVIEEKV